MVITIIEAIVSCGAVMLYSGIRVTSVLSLPLIVGIYYMMAKKIGENGKREKYIVSFTAAVIDTLAFLIGTQVIHKYDLGGLGKIAALVIMLIGGFFVIKRILEICYEKMIGLDVMEADEPNKKIGLAKSFIIILACWLPFYLWSFPGILTSDSTTQILQAINHDYSNHHPVILTWMIQLVLSVTSYFTDSLNVMVACFVILQCLFVAFVFAYVVNTLFEFRIRRAICIGALIYFAIAPYNIMMALNMWKDTLFSAGFLLFIVSLWRIIKGFRGKDFFFFALGGIILCMLRNNGWYTFVVSMPIMFWVFWKQRKDICAILACILATALMLRGPIFKHFNVSEPNIVESLAIPMQQIANVISNDKELTEEETRLLSDIIDINRIPEIYDRQCADNIKNLILTKGNTEAIANKKGEYFKTWLNIGIRNPGLYLQAFVNQTEGYYNPDIQRWQYTQGVWGTQMPIKNTPLLPGIICGVLKWYVSDWLYLIPVLGMFKSIGFFVWTMFAMLGLCIVKRKYKIVLLFVPLVIYWATVIVATPVYAEFRYIYCLFVSMPVLFMSALDSEVIKNE